MTNEFHDWAMQAWVKEVTKNMPAAKAVRRLKAGRVESRKSLTSARRSMVASQAAIQRKLNERQIAIEREFRERERIRDAEMERKRWDLLIGSR